MTTELSASEALNGFCGWLTSRQERTIMSGDDDAAPIATLLSKFCEANNLSKPRGDWSDNVVHPRCSPMVDQKDIVIHQLESLLLEKDKTISDLRASVEANSCLVKSQHSSIEQLCRSCRAKDARIEELHQARSRCKRAAEADIIELNREIRDLNATIQYQSNDILRFERAIEHKNATIDHQAEDIDGLEAEISVRKGNSKAFLGVVDIVKAWHQNNPPYQSSYTDMCEINRVVEDYLDIQDVAGKDVYVDEYRITLNAAASSVAE